MLPNNTLKIVVCGPQRVGKTVLANTISEFSNVMPTEYKPTIALRILECEREFTEEQLKNIPFLKGKNNNKVKIQLWDISGDKKYINVLFIRYQKCWPAIRYEAHGAIIVIDSKNNKYDNILDDWINNFCEGINKENIICFSYNKDEEKEKGEMKKKSCKLFLFM